MLRDLYNLPFKKSSETETKLPLQKSSEAKLLPSEDETRLRAELKKISDELKSKKLKECRCCEAVNSINAQKQKLKNEIEELESKKYCCSRDLMTEIENCSSDYYLGSYQK